MPRTTTLWVIIVFALMLIGPLFLDLTFGGGPDQVSGFGALDLLGS